MGLNGVKRVESLNDNPVFLDAAADVVLKHLNRDDTTSKQLFLRCPGCVSQKCHATKEYFQQSQLATI
jgi:protoporphyrin/coproporphyrin ferrochelatase